MNNRKQARNTQPIVQELGPTGPWLVDTLDGQGDHKVTYHFDHTLLGDVFECDCGAQYSWTTNVDVGEACIHITAACITALSSGADQHGPRH
jgi:hypothetical protein